MQLPVGGNAGIKIRHQKLLHTFFQPKQGGDGGPGGLTEDQDGLWKSGRMTQKCNVHPDLIVPSLLSRL